MKRRGAIFFIVNSNRGVAGGSMSQEELCGTPFLGRLYSYGPCAFRDSKSYYLKMRLSNCSPEKG
ncbi:MAG: hypothetical protein A2157_16530 [Deltaproteobacteria bacterium RBG_16_47_11]|nr:MAG: hypothetical protein A2157_16530 [Deltaproteobacteria bacterium RBG_16_47_11]